MDNYCRAHRCAGSCCASSEPGSRLEGQDPGPHAPSMLVVSEAEAAAIRAIYQQRGEFAAAIELRRLFPGITDNAQARQPSFRCSASCRPMTTAA